MLSCVRLNPKSMILGACGIVLFFHFLIMILQYDPSPSGRVGRWLSQHGIPSLKKGGVVVFVHPKRTGGRSLKGGLSKRDFGIHLTHPHLNSSFASSAGSIEDALIGSTTEEDGPITFFSVLHEDFGRLRHVRSSLQKWRELANKHHTALFMFTLVRDPVDYHVSCFNEYRLSPCGKQTCEQPLLEPTEADLLSSIKSNEQCRGLTKTVDDKESEVQEEECDEAFEWMQKHLDWIGTTENLSSETLPLLAELMLGDADRAESMNILNDQTKPNKLLSKSLDSVTTQKIRAMSLLDQNLYEKVKANYYL